MGVFISACLHQRGVGIRRTGHSVGKQAAVLMIQHFRSYVLPIDATVVAGQRKLNDRVDHFILHACFDGVLTGEYSSLANARKEMGLDKIRDFKLLPVPRSMTH